MNGNVCKVCGYISITGNAPDKCPVCGAPKTAFEEKENAVLTPKDAGNKTELEKKHVPVIKVIKKCDLMSGGCTDVHARIGEAQHPMQADHFIGHIDFYIDNRFIARIHLTPEKCNPAGALHLKTGAGKLTVIEFCNLHGAWINEVEL